MAIPVQNLFLEAMRQVRKKRQAEDAMRLPAEGPIKDVSPALQTPAPPTTLPRVSSPPPSLQLPPPAPAAIPAPASALNLEPPALAKPPEPTDIAAASNQEAEQKLLEAQDARNVAARLEKQNALQNAQELAVELGGPEGTKVALNQVLGQASGVDTKKTPVSAETVQRAEALAQDLQNPQGPQTKEGQAIQQNKPQDLSNQDKLAMGLLLMLPVIGGLLGGKRGLGVGLQALGAGVQQQRQDVLAAEARQAERADATSKQQLASRKLDIESRRLDLEDRRLDLLESRATKEKRVKGPLAEEAEQSEKAAKRQLKSVADVIKEEQDRPLNDAQSKSFTFSSRMEQAEETLTALEDDPEFDLNEIGTAVQVLRVPLPFVDDVDLLPNPLKGAKAQKFLQAKVNFITAVLRKESGAAISESEFDKAEETYFARPGDSVEVIAQKRESRRIALDAMKASSGLSERVFESIRTTKPEAPPAPEPVQGLNLRDMSTEDLERMLQQLEGK